MVSAFAAPSLKVTSNTIIDGTIKIDVAAQDVVDLYAYQFDLNFDPTKFQFVSGSEGPFLATAGSTFFYGGDLSAGSLKFVFDTLLGLDPGASGSGVLASFDFVALDRGTSAFSLANVLALDTPGNLLDVGLQSLEVTVPEPGTLCLLALGLAGLASARKRKFLMPS
jgi:hypothetical protein